jgi:hypothetical protein
MTEENPDFLGVAQALASSAIGQTVKQHRQSSKACGSFEVGTISGSLGEDTEPLFIPAIRSSLSIVADTIPPNSYAQLQHELDSLNAQFQYYLTDTGNPKAAMGFVTWNWIRTVSHAFPVSHPYRRWCMLGLAWGHVMRQWRDSLPADVASLSQTIRDIGDSDRNLVPPLCELCELLGENDLSEDALKVFLADRYGATDVGDLCVQFTEEMRQGIEAVPGIDTSRQSRRGKPGRPPKRAGLARFAIARRNRKSPMTWEDIAVEWQLQHPDDPVTREIVRGAVKNFKRRPRLRRS